MANLPADLPTNWTQGQIISPNGTEVGLSEQYGYNYLNEQVNNTQTEVNSLSADQTSTQQQVNSLNTQVGNIQGQVTTQGQEITALQETTNSQGQSITSLQSQVSSNDTDIAGLQQTTTTQGQNITTLQGQVSTLNQTTTTQGENITSLQSEVSAINTALDSVAQESSVQDIIDSIGATTDSGGSSTAGTLMAKMNNLLGNNNVLIPAILGNPDYISYYGNITSMSTSTSSYQTIIEVNGEGLFSGFGFTAVSPNCNSGLKVTIDGEVVYCNEKNNGTITGLFNGNYVFGGENNDYNVFSWFFTTDTSSAPLAPYIKSSDTTSETGIKLFWCELPFKSSLKVEQFCSWSVLTSGSYLYHVKNN